MSSRRMHGRGEALSPKHRPFEGMSIRALERPGTASAKSMNDYLAEMSAIFTDRTVNLPSLKRAFDCG